MIHTTEPPACAALGQRLGRIPYAHRTTVAMKRRAVRPVISLQCVADHRGTLKPEFFRFLLRYLSSWLRRAPTKLGLRSQHSPASIRLTHVKRFFCPRSLTSAKPLNQANVVPCCAAVGGCHA